MLQVLKQSIFYYQIIKIFFLSAFLLNNEMPSKIGHQYTFLILNITLTISHLKEGLN